MEELGLVEAFETKSEDSELADGIAPEEIEVTKVEDGGLLGETPVTTDPVS